MRFMDSRCRCRTRTMFGRSSTGVNRFDVDCHHSPRIYPQSAIIPAFHLLRSSSDNPNGDPK